MSDEQQTATIVPFRQPRELARFSPRSFVELESFAKLAAHSDLVPKDYRGKPGNITIACMMGAELGLAPMQALQNIAVINGRPSVWGDAMLALCQAHIDFVDCVETDDGATATCVVTRKGRAPVSRSFSMEEAKQAGLASGNVWRAYPKRMRQMRARGFALRDAFADVLRGLISAEEARDLRMEVVEFTQLAESAPVSTPEQKTETTAALPAQTQEPFRFKSGERKGDLITDVPTEYLVRLGKHPINAKMRAIVDAELERREKDPNYLTQQLQASIDAQEKLKDDLGDLPPDWGGVQTPEQSQCPECEDFVKDCPMCFGTGKPSGGTAP